LESQYKELSAGVASVFTGKVSRVSFARDVLIFQRSLAENGNRDPIKQAEHLLNLLGLEQERIDEIRRKIDAEGRKQEVLSRDAKYFTGKVADLERKVSSVNKQREYTAILKEADILLDELDLWISQRGKHKAIRQPYAALTQNIMPFANIGSKYGSPENPMWRLFLVPRLEGCHYVQEMLGNEVDLANPLTNPRLPGSPEWYIFFDGTKKMTPFVSVLNDEDPQDRTPVLQCNVLEAGFGKVKNYMDRAVTELVELTREDDFGRQTGYRDGFMITGIRSPLNKALAARLKLYPCKELEDDKGFIFPYKYHRFPERVPREMIKTKNPIAYRLGRGSTVSS